LTRCFGFVENPSRTKNCQRKLAVEKRNKVRNKTMRNTNIENLVNEVEASKVLGISSTTLRIGYRYKGLIPFVRMKDKCIRYRPSDLRKFVESRLVAAKK
jgi:hypothetical protein